MLDLDNSYFNQPFSPFDTLSVNNATIVTWYFLFPIITITTWRKSTTISYRFSSLNNLIDTKKFHLLPGGFLALKPRHEAPVGFRELKQSLRPSLLLIQRKKFGARSYISFLLICQHLSWAKLLKTFPKLFCFCWLLHFGAISSRVLIVIIFLTKVYKAQISPIKGIPPSSLDQTYFQQWSVPWL